jgi:hypothetical protein
MLRAVNGTAAFFPTDAHSPYVSSRPDGYQTPGDWQGGYDDTVQGFIQVSPTVAPGMALTSSTLAWPLGPQNLTATPVELLVNVHLWQGNWWVKAGTKWAGYYPECIGGGAPPCAQGTLFSATGLHDGAARWDWYGEVFDSSTPAATSTDMGNGQFASGNYQKAYFRNMSYWWDATHNWWLDPMTSPSLYVTDSACYNGVGPVANIPAPGPAGPPPYNHWVVYFLYGGPGKEATGCR